MAGVSASEMPCPIKLSLHVTDYHHPTGTKRYRTINRLLFPPTDFFFFFLTMSDGAASSLLTLAS